MIGRLLRWPWRRRRAAPAPPLAADLDARFARLERSLALKLEAQLVTLTRALAEVITTELARERRRTAAAPNAGQASGPAAQAARAASAARERNQQGPESRR